MKNSWLLPGLLVLMPCAVFLATSSALAQTETNASGYVIVERGLDYRIWQATNADSNGNLGQYTELSSGVNYTNASGQWVDAVEQINLLPTGGAAATQGRHQVYFPGDIYSGVIQVVTPDGRRLSHRPVGVSYDDGSNSVWIAKLKDCTGYLVGSNKVVYPDAFTGVKADLVCTYRRGGFENDLVFRQNPPSPDAYGLDPSAAVLQLFTEFFNTQDPQQIPGADDPDYGISDAELKFGQLTMIHGRAFIAGQQTTNAVDVYKSWFHVDGRTFLVEQVPLDYVAPDLNTLPASTNILTSQIQSKDPILYVAQAKRQFPPARGISHDKAPMLVAAQDLTEAPGVVLDYVTVPSGQNYYTFSAGQTYKVVGTTVLGGTTTIQGGAVIKFDSGAGHGDQQGSCLQLNGPLACTAGSYQPAVLTDINDNSVGESLGSGTPAINENQALIYAYNYSGTAPWRLNNLKFCYGICGFWAADNNDVVVRDCQFISDYPGVLASGGKMYLTNVLFSACDPAVQSWGSQSAWAQNVTAAGFSTFCSGASSLTLKDSVLTGTYVNNSGSLVNDHSSTGVATSVFQSGSLGAFYLNPNNAQSLVDQGSQLAAAAGLYHYTTRIDQVKEGGTQVDRGFHYMALDGTGNPVDTNGDGIPDYVQDVNGNGMADAGETSWILGPYNGLSFGNGLQVFTPLK